MAKGRADTMSTQADHGGFVDEEGTVIDAGRRSMPAFDIHILASFNHDGVPDLWLIAENIDGGEDDQVARLFVFDGSIQTTVVSVDSAYASWSLPMADFDEDETYNANDMWLTNPGDIDGDGHDDTMIGVEGGRTWLLNNIVP